MKQKRVLRGTIPASTESGSATQIIQDDGNLNDAWRVTKFMVSYLYPNQNTPAAFDCTGVLATSPDAFGNNFPTQVEWVWEDRRQIAWAGFEINASSSVGNWQGLIDPTHIIQRDLYVAIDPATAFSTSFFNYYVELERVSLDEVQALMALISERH